MKTTKENLFKNSKQLKSETLKLNERIREEISKALALYGEQNHTDSIEWDWEEDAPSCCYSDFGDDLCDCYITKVLFDKGGHILDINLYAYYLQEEIEHANLRYMTDYDTDLLDAIIAELD